MKPGRRVGSPYRYDRAEIRSVLETQGHDAALARWPPKVVNPIARLLGLANPYRNQIWKLEWTPQLGTKPDSVLAAELGVAAVTVASERRKLGIPTLDQKKRHATRRAALAAIPDAELAGRMEDIAARYFCSHYEVMAERKRRGLHLSPRQGLRIKARTASRSELRRVAIWAIADAYPGIALERIAEVVGCVRERVRQVIYLRDVNKVAS